MSKIITLTTDFGTVDGYLGIVKGVIFGICESAKIVDLSHDLPPWDISSAAWVISNSYPYFPPGSVHVGVVDPGVGSPRRAVAIDTGEHVFIGPDNGIFSLVLRANAGARAYELTCEKYWRRDVSSSFHARDLFGPVAAHFLTGVSLDELGKPLEIDSLVKLPAHELKVKKSRVEGAVAYIDRFGNLITNINKDYVQDSALCQVGKRSLGRIGQCYASGIEGKPIAFIGSHGYLEIAVNQGRADRKLEASVNTPVILFEAGQADSEKD